MDCTTLLCYEPAIRSILAVHVEFAERKQRATEHAKHILKLTRARSVLCRPPGTLAIGAVRAKA